MHRVSIVSANGVHQRANRRANGLNEGIDNILNWRHFLCLNITLHCEHLPLESLRIAFRQEDSLVLAVCEKAIASTHLLSHENNSAMIADTALSQRLFVGEHSSAVDQLLFVHGNRRLVLDLFLEGFNRIGRKAVHDDVVSVLNLHFQLDG